MRSIFCSMAQRRPATEFFNGGIQLSIEDLHRIQFGLGGFLANHRGDAGPMAEPVEIIAAADPNSSGHSVHMRMRGMHAAIDDCDAHYLPGSTNRLWSCPSPVRWRADLVGGGVVNVDGIASREDVQQLAIRAGLHIMRARPSNSTRGPSSGSPDRSSRTRTFRSPNANRTPSCGRATC